jgi:hypothetical protein
VHTFTANLKTAGLQSLSVADTATNIIGQAQVQVNAAAAYRFVLTAPTSAPAAYQYLIIVTAFDPYGNVATGYTATVHFTDNGKNSNGLPTNYTFKPSDNGVRTFGATAPNQKGAHLFKVVDAVVGSIIGSWTINVT